SEDIYIDIKILSWVNASGNVTYERATAPGAVGTAYSVEDYHSDFKHYFSTTNPIEATGLDVNRGGWTRTGQAYPVVTTPGAGMLPVCRFFSSAFAPLSSHFYTLDPAECSAVKGNTAWTYEGNAFFAEP